jgi:hypothetical protein
MISSYRKTVFTSENTSSSVVADRGRRRHGVIPNLWIIRKELISLYVFHLTHENIRIIIFWVNKLIKKYINNLCIMLKILLVHLIIIMR